MQDTNVPEQTWFFTFGHGQQFADQYVRITGTHNGARAEMVEHFGTRWAFQYSSARSAGVEEFGLVELPREQWPQPAPEMTSGYVQAVKDALTAAGVAVHWDETTIPDAVDLWLTPIEVDTDPVLILGWRENEGGWYLAESDGVRFWNRRFGLPLLADPAYLAREVAARMPGGVS